MPIASVRGHTVRPFRVGTCARPCGGLILAQGEGRPNKESLRFPQAARGTIILANAQADESRASDECDWQWLRFMHCRR